ncbi:MAG: DUF4358 domain-containing protein [Lachnospiraceae bacterium]|nr:DUF4358 domain-containing protein [Lachnospiraceae bacterium]
MKKGEMNKGNGMKRAVSLGLSLVIAAGLLLAGCGSKKAMNVDEVSGRLLKEITYQDELNAMSLEQAAMFLNLSDISVKSGAIYETSGWTAEEIVVLECETAADADKAKAMLETRVAEQITNYTDYVPEELDKLHAAVIVESGNFAVLSVSNDPDQARSILSEYQ